MFRVIAEDGGRIAMKIVNSGQNIETVVAVEAEVASLRSIEKAGGHAVRVMGSLAYYCNPWNHKVNGVGYLMAEIGTIIRVKECRDDRALMEEVFQELYQLHTLRLYHGDPQIHNIIRDNGKLLWIDFMRTNLDKPTHIEFQNYIKHDVNGYACY